MSVSIIAAAAPQAAINTNSLVDYLQSLFGPLFLGSWVSSPCSSSLLARSPGSCNSWCWRY